MAELFMECEEEELEPWQQKVKPIVVDDDDDDDEPIFVGEILSPKPSNTYILNRVNPSSPRIGMQNGAPKRGAVAVSPGFHSATRPITSTLAVQPQPRISNVSGTSQVLQRPLSGCSSLQEAAKASTGISQPTSRSATTQSLSRNLSIPVMAQSASRPVATVTAQPVPLNRVIPNNTSAVAFGLMQNSGVTQCQSGSAVNTTGLSKRPSTSEASSITPKKAKANETGSGGDSPISPSVKPPNDPSLLQKGTASSNVKNGAPFPQACPKCNIHFNLFEPLKNHIKYCCPDMAHTFLGITKTDCSGTSTRIAETEKGKLIMLVNDFYYGKHEGNIQQVHQEQKTHTTFKCGSCMKLLKSNIRFMNHMKHHLELEKQNSESWESHTTCQHCYRQFPTPFQLQCHIESSHTPHESSTLCKICELSFETEQVLLQHMKDNHKPGEMPYVCQVCNYRSSAFSDVEKHFRAVHENTKNLLCPFCLKVIKIGAPYMHHFMRHQKKGVHRCTKCRLQFLTCKEKMDHKSQHHRTFKKPVQLEGLPPGTKVTIRASAGSLQPGSMSASPVSPSASTLQLSPSAKVTNAKATHNKLNANKAKPKLKPLSVQKKQSLGTSSITHNNNSSSSNGSSSSSSKRNNKIANTSLNNLRCPDIQKCIECYSDIRTFASHFPAYVRCSLCRYSTSCSKAYVNHMMSFHSARQSKRFWIYKTHSEDLRGVTLVCLNCDFLTDVSGLDKMATHLNESHAHTCQVIKENVPLDYLAAENLSHLANDALLNNESEETSQKLSRPSTPEEQNETSAPVSPQIKYSAEETNQDHLGNQSDEAALNGESEENKLPVLENSFGSGLQSCSNDCIDTADGGEAESCLENQRDEAAIDAACEEKKSPCLENISDSGFQACSKDSLGEGGKDDLANQGEEGPLAAECEENVPPSVLESSPSGFSVCSNAPIDLAEKTDKDSLTHQGDEGPFAAECEESTLILEKNTSSGLSTSSNGLTDPAEGDTYALANQTDEGVLSADCKENTSVSTGEAASISDLPTCSKGSMGEGETNNANQGDEVPLVGECKEKKSPCLVNISDPGFQVCSKGSLGEGDTDDLANQGDEGLLAAECKENPSPSVLESSHSGFSACSNDSIDPAGKDADSLAYQDNKCNSAAECEESTLPLVLENRSGSGLSACANDPIDPLEEGDANSSIHQSDDPVVAKCKESPSTGEKSSISEPHVCPKGSAEEASRGHLENQTDEDKESTSMPTVKNSSCPGLQASSMETSCERTESDNLHNGDQTEEGKSPKSAGNEINPCQRSEDTVSAVQTKVDDLDEDQFADMNTDNSKLASDEDVSFEQFLRRSEPESANSDMSEQGSVHLEPLTPSEVLEYEATEILQKGGVPPSAKKAGLGSEQADVAASTESSPSHIEVSASQVEESDEAS
ncbi:zinc finger protein 280D [Rhineura floridana]|uniref:zinc finger protein 280D n=1 Tax=Rhineura floridana TaxID=261503 RepID=UPI002AC7FF6D|nr:zinc finger protein 280D [Rhineura floridana]